MKRTPGYLLQNIAGTDYLLPYGQQIADHRRGVAVNETGRRIWELLERERSRDELRREYLKCVPAGGTQESELTRDLDQFLNLLVAWGLMEDDAPDHPQTQEPRAHVAIAGLTLALYCPEDLVDHSHLKDFRVPPQSQVDQRVRLLWGPPKLHTNGSLLVRDAELVVCERERDYLLFFPTFDRLWEVSLSKDGGEVTFYCRPPVNDELIYQFFHALRMAFLYLAQKRGMWAIHSASLLYRDKVWLFSASSGTGKSTHVDFWRELYHTPPVNGDLNLLALEEGRTVVRGIPWCGTSEIFDKRTLPLGGIVLLKRAAQDDLEELPGDRRALLVMQRFISPTWTAAQFADGAAFAQELAQRAPICRLRCTKSPSAAELIKGWIDRLS